MKFGSLLQDFCKSIREGFQQAALSPKNLPLNNKTPMLLAYLDPGAGEALKKLPDMLPNVVSPNDLGLLDLEIRSYCTDKDITNLKWMKRPLIFGLM